jgi:hypothetical protein
MFGRKTARKNQPRERNRPWLSVAVLAVLTAAIIGSLVFMVRHRTALRVVGLEWERIVEVEEFTGERWIVTREEVAAGESTEDALHWPDPKLERTGNCDGCQREGKRRSSYTVRLLDPVTDRGHGCQLDEARWKEFRPGSRWIADFDPQTGLPICDTLRSAD